MKTFEYVITDAVGIHARPAGVLAKEVKKLASKVTITSEAGKSAEARKLIAVMGLGVKCGEKVTVCVEGEDEETAAPRIEAFFRENF